MFVPSAIIDVCHDFYHSNIVNDVWYPTIKSNFIEIESNGKKCVHTKSGWHSIFGSQVFGIDDAIDDIIWRIRATGTDRLDSTYFMMGIIEDIPDALNTNWIGCYNKNQYAFYNEGTCPVLPQRDYEECDEKFLFYKVGQELGMVLNLKKQTLNFIVDGVHVDIGYTDIDNTKKYRMGISFCDGINEIEIL